MYISRPQLDATIAAYSFSTATNFFVTINLCTLYLPTRRELPGSSSNSVMSLRMRKRRTFLAVAIAQLLVATAVEAVFFTLSFAFGQRHAWPIFLLNSIVLMNMWRECLWTVGSWSYGQRSFYPYLIAGILIMSWPCFIAGALLGGKFPVPSRVLSSSSAILYRLWMAWEWAQVAAYAMTDKRRILFYLMIHILAFGASAVGTLSKSQMDHLLTWLYFLKRALRKPRRMAAEGSSTNSLADVPLGDLNVSS
ncbi:hypothetical protein B0T10DRAFT_463249 [Thelonectria olida]|uniref:Uncharacterized protein n=1 Tax=Thelonectria olida TaxID=1576542 RepID=A0A9P9ANZ8_9HYPO|nr:hypothetical protein B0T10DRAFT_463249 [Thelonectria olida]